jgi:hypothetical protein
VWQTNVVSREDYDTDPELRDVLLVVETTIGREQYLKGTSRASQQISVLQRGPTLFLNGPDFELG